MSDMPKRVRGENLPHLASNFPKPWPLTVSVSGWFCDQWPAEGQNEWPGNDLDTNSTPDDSDGEDDTDDSELSSEDQEPNYPGQTGVQP